MWKRFSGWRQFSSAAARSSRYNSFRGSHGANQFPVRIQWNHNTTKIAGAVGALGLAFYVTHLEKAPVTGRTRFMCISESLERQIGDSEFEQQLQEFKPYLLPDNSPTVQRVKNIMRRIIAVSGIKDVEWRVFVVDKPGMPPNAFVMPNGKVFVFSSILPICGDDDGLATVLAHETAHQVARHTAEKLSWAPIYMLVGFALYAVTGSDAFNRFIVSSLMEKPSSRHMETEADYIGLMMMSKACFHPHAAIGLWERMLKAEGSHALMSKMQFLSTHPSSEKRIQNMIKWQPEAEEERRKAGCDEHDHQWPGFQNFSRNF
ncbi:Mitochondrial metalloendopeptidase OMA1 [Yarrowia sp. B02]|nr:Mitochondrial metalloendopeptidase OMA1 [Yarrowia sp. B02]